MAFSLKRNNRKSDGSSFIEMPFAIWLLLLGIVMPLICFATLGIRYNFFLNAARTAAHVAAHAKSFQQDFPPDLSSQTIASNTATTCCKAFNGVQLDAITTAIVITPVTGGAPLVQTTKLANAADEENFLYQIQVTLNGQLSPLINLPGGVFGFSIPGLTEPYPITTIAKEVSENTQGLDR